MPLSAGTGLQSARVAWRHSLRFRLALTYTLAALALMTLLTLGVTWFLLGRMDKQFEGRLNDRAAALVERLTNTKSQLGVTLPPISGYTAIIDTDGNLLAVSQTFQDSEMGTLLAPGTPFPYLNVRHFALFDTPMRATTQPAGDVGTVWVALPESDLLSARNSAALALICVLLLTPLLMLPLGWWVGQRTLNELGKAAYLADCTDPTRSLDTLPLPQREDEVHRLLSAINRLLVRIEVGQQREKQLLGQIVHELGAPLTVLKASLQRAGERTGDPEVMRAALVADELNFTTQDLMQLARGQLEMKLVWHYIPATTLQSRLDRLVAGVHFTGDWTGGILCDPDRLTQALRNLLANARRHAGAAGQVTADLWQDDKKVTFTIRDSGPGLPTELGDQIFEPFVSGAGSSGLGLSVARQIARMHGGELIGRNHEGSGAEFVLSLPSAALLAEDEENEDDSLEEDSAEEQAMIDAHAPA